MAAGIFEWAYDYRNCQSLFGYAEKVHRRSGGVCELCGCGAGESIDFDLWRQFTVEHLIGDSQKGYLKHIKTALMIRFPDLPNHIIDELACRIDETNTVSACSFCNATTSKGQHAASMEQLILETEGGPEEVIQHVSCVLADILEAKRRAVRWKLESVRRAFHDKIESELLRGRSGLSVS